MAPEPVSVTALPAQMVALELDAVTVGPALTVIVWVAVLEQPFVSRPVTVYVVLDDGFTVTAAPERLPGFHVYTDPPEAVSVILPPEQIVVLDAVTEIVGFGFTVMVCTAELIQPFASVPVTVYVVLVVGETVTEFPVSDPGIQVYELAPFAVSVVLLPSQMVLPDAVAVTLGVGLTVIVLVEVLPQPLASVPVTV